MISPIIKKSLRVPQNISSDLFIEVNNNTQAKLEKIIYFTEFCGGNINDLEIWYKIGNELKNKENLIPKIYIFRKSDLKKLVLQI